MRIVLQLPAGPPPRSTGNQGADLNALSDYVGQAFTAVGLLFQTVEQILNGQVSFGDGIESDNIPGVWIEYNTNVVADTEDTLQHNLGVIPVGVIVMEPPQSGVINKGSTPWTTTEIFLQCSQGSQTAKIFVLSPPILNA